LPSRVRPSRTQRNLVFVMHAPARLVLVSLVLWAGLLIIARATRDNKKRGREEKDQDKEKQEQGMGQPQGPNQHQDQREREAREAGAAVVGATPAAAVGATPAAGAAGQQQRAAATAAAAVAAAAATPSTPSCSGSSSSSCSSSVQQQQQHSDDGNTDGDALGFYSLRDWEEWVSDSFPDGGEGGGDRFRGWTARQWHD
jgi:hypothetical protein